MRSLCAFPSLDYNSKNVHVFTFLRIQMVMILHSHVLFFRFFLFGRATRVCGAHEQKEIPALRYLVFPILCLLSGSPIRIVHIVLQVGFSCL